MQLNLDNFCPKFFVFFLYYKPDSSLFSPSTSFRSYKCCPLDTGQIFEFHYPLKVGQLLSIEENDLVLSPVSSSSLSTHGQYSVDKVTRGICARSSHLVEITNSSLTLLPLLSLPPLVGSVRFTLSS